MLCLCSFIFLKAIFVFLWAWGMIFMIKLLNIVSQDKMIMILYKYIE